MIAGGAYGGCLKTDDDVPAVAALPNLDVALFEHLLRLHIVQQRAVALLMVPLDGGDQTEPVGKLGEPFLLGGLGKALVHIRPLVVFTLGGGQQIFRRVADAGQLLEPELGVLLFVFRRFQKKRCDLFKSLLFGDGGKEGVFVARFGFAGKSHAKILLGLCSAVFGFLHDPGSFLIKNVPSRRGSQM